MGYTQTGTPYYASPEVWKDQPYDSKSDIWSLGCVTFEMMALKPPFREENMEKLYNKVIRGQYGKISDKYSDDIKEIIKFMLKVNPQDRPSCGQILNHELVKKRMEFFQAQSGFDDDNLVRMEEGILLKTIRLPKNILFLTEKLPAANYNNKGNTKEDSNSDKKKTFPNLPNIKFQFNKNQNQTNNNKFISNLKVINKNNTNFTSKTGKNIIEKNYLNNKIKDENLDDIKNNINLELNDGEKINNLNNLNIIPIDKNIKTTNNNNDNIDLFMGNNNNEIKRNKINSKKNLIHNEEEKKTLNNKFKREEINKNRTKRKLLKKEKSNILKNLEINYENRIRYNSCEKKEFDSSNLNHKKNEKEKKPNNDDFQKYLNSIGLGDLYKLYCPNTIENNYIKNTNNRYRPGNKFGNYLPNIFSLNKNNKNDIFGENKIIPNRRLVPLEKKII